MQTDKQLESMAARVKAAQPKTAPKQFLPLDIGGGVVVSVPVCWSPEKCAEYLARAWKGGPMVLATLRDPSYQRASGVTDPEHAYFLRAAEHMVAALSAPGSSDASAASVTLPMSRDFRAAPKGAAPPALPPKPRQFRRT
jgi:hypothetical protein